MRRNTSFAFAAQLSALSLLTLIFKLSPCSAQDTLHAPVPYSVFPLGAIREAKIDTIEKMLGMNVAYGFSNVNGKQVSAIGSPRDAISSADTMQDPFYYPPGGDHRVTPVAILSEAVRAHDVRVYTPGTS